MLVEIFGPAGGCGGGSGVVGEVVGFEDEVPAVEAVRTAVAHDVAGLPHLAAEVLGIGITPVQQVGPAPAVDARDLRVRLEHDADSTAAAESSRSADDGARASVQELVSPVVAAAVPSGAASASAPAPMRSPCGVTA